MSIYAGNKKIAGLIRGEDISHATEIHAGIIEISTQSEVNEGIDDLKSITPLKLKNKLNDYSKKTELPTKVSELENDSDFASKDYVQTQIEESITNAIGGAY